MANSWRDNVTPTSVISSMAIAVMQTGAAISLSALVFAGPASDRLASGSSTFLLGSAMASIVIAWRSSFAVVVGGARNNVTVVIAAVAASIAVSSPDHPGSTVAVFVMIAAITSGIVLYVTGRFRLGHLVRFMPFPVMGGYIAGTAWLMLKGGLAVMVDAPLSWSSFQTLVEWPTAKFWLPGITLALLMNFLRGATRQSLIIAGSLIAFLVVAQITSSPSDIQAAGWVVGPFPESDGISLFQPSDFGRANWSEIAAAGPGLAAIALIALIAALLNVSGVEFASNEEVNMNHELRTSGIASVLSGAGGGTTSFIALGPTVLARQLQASSRLVATTFAALAAVTIVAGPGFVGWMPRFVAGAMIMGPGIALVRQWLRDSILQGPMTDRMIALLIPLVVGFVGVLEAVGVGIVAAAGLFIWRYASIDPIRNESSGRGTRSTTDRSDAENAVLTQHGNKIVVLHLDGFLFFGTAARVGERVTALLAENPVIEHLIIDFRRVSGVDSSARNELVKVLRRCHANNTKVQLAAMPEDLMRSFEGHEVNAVVDADRALAQAEVSLLAGNAAHTRVQNKPQLGNDVLNHFTQVQILRGTTLLATGHESTTLFYIQKGTLTVWAEAASGPVRLRQVGPGAFLGEVGFFSTARALATVTADVDCVLLQLGHPEYIALATSQPHLALRLTTHVLAKTTERLVITNALVRDLSD